MIAWDSNGELVGFADSGPGRDEDRPGIPELYSIYTLGRTHGTGLGAALLHATMGDSPGYVWVLKDNPRAQAFYRKNGFRPDGTRKLLPPD